MAALVDKWAKKASFPYGTVMIAEDEYNNLELDFTVSIMALLRVLIVAISISMNWASPWVPSTSGN